MGRPFRAEKAGIRIDLDVAERELLGHLFDQVAELLDPGDGDGDRGPVDPLAAALGLEGEQADQGAKIMQALSRIFTEKDCSLIEINPLVVAKDGRVVAIDAKCNLDDNALFRQDDVAALRDRAEEDPREAQAADYGFSYVSLDGNFSVHALDKKSREGLPGEMEERIAGVFGEE